MARLETHAAYALWSLYYPPVAHNPLMEVEEQAVVSLLPPVDGLRALDAGCGTGRYMRLLQQRGAKPVIGVDRSAAMAAHARGAVVLGDLCALPLQAGSIDVIVCGLAMNDVRDVAAAMRELARVLVPDGVLVLSALHPRGGESKWMRTFEAGGETWSLPAEWHSFHAYRHACEAVGLQIEEQLEPRLTDRGPVALVIRARRTMALWNPGT